MRSAGRKEGLRVARLGRRRGKNMPEAVEVYAVARGAAPRRRPAVRRALAAAVALLLIAGVGV